MYANAASTNEPKIPPRPAYRFRRNDPPTALAHLREKQKWVAWRYERKARRQKWDKVPIDPRTGRYASVDNPDTWTSFDEAKAAMERHRADGVGLVLTGDDGIVGGDLDDCIDDAGCYSPLAMQIVSYAETYAEHSPSGHGIRFFAHGKLDKALRDDHAGIELYSKGRFLTVTGNSVDGTPSEMREAPRTLAHLIHTIEARRAERGATTGNGNGYARRHGGSDFFANVNVTALARLDSWVPTLHPTARKHSTGAWRISSPDLGRGLEEDLAYHPTGIKDHGQERGLTAIDAVLKYGDAADVKAAAMWLCEKMAIDPSGLGWKGDRTSVGSDGTPAEDMGNTWPDPMPLPTSLLPVEPLDYGMLPENLRPWVEDVADRMQCPPDYVAVAVMVALGILIGRKVSLRPKIQDDWSVVGNMWGLCIGPPGAMKTPAQNEPLRPLRELSAAAREVFNLAKAEYDIKAATAKVRTENNKKEASKKLAKDRNAIIDDLLKPAQPDGDEPTLRRYITTNATYEALAIIAQENPNGILVDRDEMLSLLDRLDEEGHADERGFYLSGWNGDTPYTVDRIGRGLDLHCEAVCISMIGGTQPARISQYLAHVRRGRRGNDGLIQRFGLMVWPDIPPSWTNIDRKPNRVARDAAFRVFQALDVLDWHGVGAKRDRGVGGDEEGLPHLRPSQEAQDLLVAWRDRLERRLRQGELDPMIEGHLAKYRKLVPGLALIIHLADGGIGEVSKIAAEKALKWATYLETHAARTYASTTIASADAARAIIAKIKSGHLKGPFPSHHVWRKQWSLLRDRDTVQAALQLLVDYDWLSVATVETGGRRATLYTVNPMAVRCGSRSLSG